MVLIYAAAAGGYEMEMILGTAIITGMDMVPDTEMISETVNITDIEIINDTPTKDLNPHLYFRRTYQD